MYGSSFIRRTLRPRASRIAPRQAEVMPLPSEDTTPPVMKMNRVMSKPGGPNAASSGSTRPAIEVECLIHRDGSAKYQKYLGPTSPAHATPRAARRSERFRRAQRRMLRPAHAPTQLVRGRGFDV